ncbi:hypothetical protein SDC9_51673 [bioreactor metagenome]|uniref:Uncharacterized protein n=1 Tax=bioreactor metagenome TaxID=1076179 RepID=A0A644WT86_9ZZZZ
MNRVSAMQSIDGVLKNDFKYLYKRHNIEHHTLHLTFQMDSKSHSLQMCFDFQERWCNILCFISPTILTPCSDNYWEALQTVNYINWNIKSWGRYYIDTYGDLAYSLRLDYDVLDRMPHECAKEIKCAIDYYADLFVPLLNICQGKASFTDTKQFIDDMWGGMQ